MRKKQIVEYLAYVCQAVGIEGNTDIAKIVAELIRQGKVTEEEVGRFFPGKK